MAGVAPHQDIIVLFNPTAIRDTNNYYSQPVNGQGHSKRTIKVNNNLNQALNVYVEVSRDGQNWESFENLGSAAATSVTVFGFGKAQLVSTGTPLPWWRLRLQASTAPTSGTVDAWAIQYSF